MTSIRPYSRLDRIIVLVPLLLAALWLPLRGGGTDRGPLLGVQALTFVALAWVSARRGLGRPLGGLQPLMWVVALLLLATAVSTAFSQDLDASVPAFLVWAWLGASTLLYLAVAEEPRVRRILAGALVAAVLMQTFWSFFVWWGGGEAAPGQSGTFYAPNQYAGYLVLLAPMLLATSLTRSARREAAAWGVLAAFVYLGVALSGSRAGVGAALIGVGAAVVLAARGAWRQVLLRTALIVLGFLGGGLFLTSALLFPDRGGAPGEAPPVRPSGPLGSVVAKEGTGSASLAMRLHWAQGAIEIGRRRPLTGSGLGTYGDMFVQVQDPRWHWSRYAHNHYLEALAEGGLPLMLGTLMLPLAALIAGYRTIRVLEVREAAGHIGLAAGLLGASAHLVLDHDWSFPGYSITYLVVALLLVSPPPGGETAKASAPDPLRRSPRLVVAGASVLLLAAVGGNPLSLQVSGSVGGQRSSEARLARLGVLLAPYATGPRQTLAQRLVANGGPNDLRAAARVLRGAVALDELDPHLRWDLAAVYVASGDVAAARRAYRSAVVLAPNAPGSYLLAGQFELEVAQDPVAAARILDEGISRLMLRPTAGRLAGSIADLLVLRSIAEEKLSGPQAALRFATQATELAPRSSASWLRVSQLSCETGDAARARAAAERAGTLAGTSATSSKNPGIPASC